MTKLIDYTAVANAAVPVVAGCFDCDDGNNGWRGAGAREHARMHAKQTRHAVWVECAPALPKPEENPA
jgi:hypothetical protein